MSVEEARRAFERVVVERDWWNRPSFTLSETGSAYEAPWLQEQFVWFQRGYAAAQEAIDPKMQHVGYFDEDQFQWMSGIAPRKCELFAEFVKK